MSFPKSLGLLLLLLPMPVLAQQAQGPAPVTTVIAHAQDLTLNARLP